MIHNEIERFIYFTLYISLYFNTHYYYLIITYSLYYDDKGKCIQSLDHIDLDSPGDLAAMPEVCEESIKSRIEHSIEINGFHAWTDHLEAARLSLDSEGLGVEELGRLVGEVLEDRI